uniref:3-keto-disaccharide hydrolase n=1 Tax=Shewanella gaetbuli TaxID=220752 RepID=UPI003B594C6B
MRIRSELLSFNLMKCLFVIFSVSIVTDVVAKADESEWISLFNGKDLSGWTPKFNGHPLGENVLDTFQAADGKLIVSYSKHKTFDEKFGHLFYHQPYSHYILKAEYRFIGEQIPGAPDWAIRNNGLMLHSQAPESMALFQEFPVSMETQLLGGLGSGHRNTGNVCSIGTHVVLDGKLDETHCISSNSKTYHGDQWVEVEVEVHGSERIIHRINGEEVFSYTDAQYDPSEAQKFIDKSGSIYLSEGYIAIQAESHPTEFRNIKLKPLKGDPVYTSNE